MSAYDVCIDGAKPWLNARVNNLTVDSNATVTGTLTVSGKIIGPEDASSITLYGASNQVNFQINNTGNILSLNATTPATTCAITFPDPLGNDSVAYLNATQTMTNKTLTLPKISSISNTGTLALPVTTDTLVGRNTVDTMTNKTLTSPILTTPTAQVTFTISANGSGSKQIALSGANVTTDSIIIPDNPVNDTFVLANTTQTLSSKSFSDSVTVSNAANQIVLGTTYQTTINCSTISNNRTINIPTSTNTTDQFTLNGYSNTLTSINYFTQQVTFSKSVDQVYFQPNGTGNGIAISGVTPVSQSTITLPDPGGTSSDTFVYANIIQTLTNKTLTSPSISNPSYSTSVSNSHQPCFIAYMTATQLSATGNGALFTIPFSTTWVNQGSNFNTTTYTFTVPVTGQYLMTGTLGYQTTVTNPTRIWLILAGSSNGARLIDRGSNVDSDSVEAIPFSIIWHCVQGETYTLQTEMSGCAGNSVNILGGGQSSSIATTYWCVSLLN